jgi:hypothetical protein
MTWPLLLVLGLLCACGSFPPSASDNAESYSVLEHVKSSVDVPESVSLGRDRTRSERFVLVTGVEDRSVQDEIIAAAAEGRRLHSTQPVVVVFYVGTIVRHSDGGVRFPDGQREVRREVVP